MKNLTLQDLYRNLYFYFLCCQPLKDWFHALEKVLITSWLIAFKCMENGKQNFTWKVLKVQCMKQSYCIIVLNLVLLDFINILN